MPAPFPSRLTNSVAALSAYAVASFVVVSWIVLVNAFFHLAREGNENGEWGRGADFV